MKQIVQHFRTGAIEVTEIPCPAVRRGHLVIQSTVSLISPGTERMLIEFGQAGLLGKARAQPERVRQLWTKLRTDGVGSTVDAVRRRLDEPFPLGYSNVGRVVEIGPDVRSFAVGDRVVSNGPHAEAVCVPTTLAAAIPDGVDDDDASFTVQAAIALNAIRLIEVTLGENVVVVGLGLLGMLAVQLLRAHGCRVLGVDVNTARCDLARRFGCEVIAGADGGDPVRAAHAFSRDRGVDAVLIAASAKTDDIVHQAAQMCRKRGRIVLLGVVDLGLQRSDFYAKELTFRVACSYGPGRYDPAYEVEARDYPLPYVRWTAARNFEAVLNLLAARDLEVRPLISHRIAHADATHAYDVILNDPTALAVILEYPTSPPPSGRVVTLGPRSAAHATVPQKPVVGIIGAGNFVRATLLPAITGAGGVVAAIASASGLSGVHAARSSSAAEATTDYRELLRASDIGTVFIATPHDSHPALVAEALAAGKHVFVEKPLAIDTDGLELVRRAYESYPGRQLMVGFNRRFAPHAVAVRALLHGRMEPIALNIIINAGDLAADHWTRDPGIGGGRIIGEACHFLDLALFLVGRPITGVQAVRMAVPPQAGCADTMTINLSFADGSLASIHYWTNGSRTYPKEEITVFSAGRIVRIENWRKLRAFGWRGVARMRQRQDKGHHAEVAAFLDRVVAGGPPLIPFGEIEQVTAASLAAVRSAAGGLRVELRQAVARPVSPNGEDVERMNGGQEDRSLRIE